MNALWEPIRYLETEPTARKFLTERYHTNGFEHSERLAFQQSTRFVYTWKQAREFYRAAAGCDLLIKPLLLFYGCTHLLKGLLMSIDPHYPQNSKVLQHGVSSRKIKRPPYHLLDDEVRPQKEGFFSYLSKLLRLSPLQQRYTVKELFLFLPDLSHDYSTIVENSSWQKVNVSSMGEISFPPAAHGTLAYSRETFVQYLNRLCPAILHFNFILSPNTEDKTIYLNPSDNQSIAPCSLERHPLFSRSSDGHYYFWNDSPEYLPLPVWASHYLLLYALSMLCRYETEYWGELILTASFAETILIERFLAVHESIFPWVIKELINKNNTPGE